MDKLYWLGYYAEIIHLFEKMEGKRAKVKCHRFSIPGQGFTNLEWLSPYPYPLCKICFPLDNANSATDNS